MEANGLMLRLFRKLRERISCSSTSERNFIVL